MAGETVTTEALCMRIVPWSRTSHVVGWLTPRGRVLTVVKGAVRPKSMFLGQYDLNYTCEIVYYARAKGELHALRECSPLKTRDALRGDFRALAAADWCREAAWELAPEGPEAGEWRALAERTLDSLAGSSNGALAHIVKFEAEALNLAGLKPEIEAESGSFALRGERRMPVRPEVARCIKDPLAEKNPQILLAGIPILHRP